MTLKRLTDGLRSRNDFSGKCLTVNPIAEITGWMERSEYLSEKALPKQEPAESHSRLKETGRDEPSVRYALGGKI